MPPRHGRDRPRRLIRPGDSYTTEELERGEVELEQPPPRPEPPPEVQGEPWGWTKPGPRPRGWREDGRYDDDPDRRNPGPLDGRWPDDEPD